MSVTEGGRGSGLRVVVVTPFLLTVVVVMVLVDETAALGGATPQKLLGR